MRVDLDIEATISLEVPKNTTPEKMAEIIQEAFKMVSFKPILKKAEIVDTMLHKIGDF